jgi:glycosyltransferase involved in cell wall biosynthesis
VTLRVALDARKLNGADSGIGSYILNLSRALLDEDPDLELLLVRNRSRPHGIASPRVSEVFVPLPAESPLTPLALAWFLRKSVFDVFHAPFDHAPRGLGRPLVVTIHDLNWIVNPAYNSNNAFVRFAGGAFYRASLSSSMNQASRILAVSQATRHAIVEHAPWHEPKVRVAYNGTDPSRIFPMEPADAWKAVSAVLAPDTPFVLTVGQGAPYKNHLNAVRGFLRAFSGRPEYRMVLVRRRCDSDGALDELLRTPSARAQVIVLPYVAPGLLNALYNTARMVLHPSYYEGFGLPLVEAMAARVPIVTSNVSAMPEVAGDAALLVSPADPGSIAAALVKLDEDEALRRRLVAEGARRLELFTWRACARTALEAYRESAGHRPHDSLRLRE